MATTASSDRPCIVGIAGAAGAGKTTLVQALLARMPDAAAVYVDHYQRITREPVRRIVQWAERGANFDEFTIPLLPDHLDELKQGRAVVDPATAQDIPARKYVLFETHFGRAHRATGRHIDLLLWLDTPNDVALARNIMDFLRPLCSAGPGEPRGERIAWIYNYLETYVASVRRLVLLQEKTVRSGADVILEGGGDAASLAEHAHAEILKYRL